MNNKKLLGGALLGALLVTSYVDVAKASASTAIKTQTSDGVTIHGEKYFSNLNGKSPLILLFHQAGSNGRGEYGELIPWLNKSGFRVIAWDQRSGGKHFGSDNRTVNALPAGTANSYCDAYPDLQAALDFTVKKGLADNVVVWGSSYSAALVVQLAAKNNGKVSGVASFSPASGGPMVDCRARQWIGKVKAPMLFMRPESEMTRDSSVEQKAILIKAGADFSVVKHGVHGSSMLVDTRTKHDMTQARAGVIKWLKDNG
ncbi:MAG: alpha/beta fold hydrolase [Algicola sp.]|nr:alpha/beta fold hydrolase [Algicola sp.]